MKRGIICIETEWQITKKKNRLSLNSEPLLRFMEESYGIPFIYRRIATQKELIYYLKQFCKNEYAKYEILYFSFHGQTHGIKLEGEKELSAFIFSVFGSSKIEWCILVVVGLCWALKKQ